MRRAPEDAPPGSPPAVRRQAAAARADAAKLRDRAAFLTNRSKQLTDALVRMLLETESKNTRQPEVFRFRAGRIRSAVALARRRLRSWLESEGVDRQEAAEITLAVSEAVANAIQHPVAPTRQAVEIEGRRTADGLELTVRDFGRWRPREAGASRNGGRGLQMIERLMDSAEVVSDGHETKLVMRRRRR